MAAMDNPGFASASSEGFDVTSNTETAEALQANLDSEKAEDSGETEEEKVSKAASELGKKGGKASAEAKRAKSGAAETVEAETGDDAEEVRDVESGRKPLGKPRDDPKARIAQVLRERDEALRERTEYAEALAEARRKYDALRTPEATQAPQPKAKDQNKEPDPADYEEYRQYEKDLARWAARQEFREAQEEAQHREGAQAYARSVDSAVGKYVERINKAKEADPDFMTRVSQDIWDRLSPSFEREKGEPLTQYHVIADEVMSSDQTCPLLLHFSEHPEDFQRIASLQTPRAIAREIAKLEARFDAVTADTSSKPTISTAKPPVRSVAGTPSTVEREDDDLSVDEFLSRETRRVARR